MEQADDSVKKEINSFEADFGGWNSTAGWTKVVANFDTGAAHHSCAEVVGEGWIGFNGFRNYVQIV